MRLWTFQFNVPIALLRLSASTGQRKRGVETLGTSGTWLPSLVPSRSPPAHTWHEMSWRQWMSRLVRYSGERDENAWVLGWWLPWNPTDSSHVHELRLSLRKQPTFREVATWALAKRRLSNEPKNFTRRRLFSQANSNWHLGSFLRQLNQHRAYHKAFSKQFSANNCMYGEWIIYS